MITDNTGLITTDDFTVTILYKTFDHYSTYQAPIRTTAGVVSGGGTVGSNNRTFGFEVKVKNTGNESRSFYFKIAQFSDVATRDVGRQIDNRLDDIKPGYTKSFDIDLYDKSLHPLYLEEIVVINPPNNTRLVELPQFCSMLAEAQKNVTPAQRSKRLMLQRVRAIFGFVLWGAVLVAVGMFGKFLFDENKRDEQRQSQFKAAMDAKWKAKAVDAPMKGTWDCIDDRGGAKSDPITIGDHTLSQGTTTVELLPHVGLKPDRHALQKVSMESAASYLSAKSALQLTSISSSSLNMTVYVAIPGAIGYKTDVYTCHKGQ